MNPAARVSPAASIFLCSLEGGSCLRVLVEFKQTGAENHTALICASQLAFAQALACGVDAILPLRQILMRLREAQVQFAAIG